jgi:hypothetical protein
VSPLPQRTQCRERRSNWPAEKSAVNAAVTANGNDRESILKNGQIGRDSSMTRSPNVHKIFVKPAGFS